jgi:hypothetical protein
MKKLNILDFKKLAKPHSKIINGECFTFKGSSHNYGYGLTYDSNRKMNKNNFNNNSKKKYGINHFMDYLRGAKIFKYNQKANKNISINSLGNISYKKVANNNKNSSSTANRIKSPINVSHSCTATINNIPNNSKIIKNSMVYSIKNASSIHNKKKKNLNSKEHKKTKSINIGPTSYPCFNCFFNIINDNGSNNNKSKLNNITIDMNYGRSKKKIIFLCDKNAYNHKQKNDTNNTMIENNINNNLNNKKGNIYSNNLNLNKKINNGNNNVISNYYININNQVDNRNINNGNCINKKNKKENSKIINQKFKKIISQSQQDLVQPIKAKKKNYTTKNSPSKILSQRISTDNNSKHNNLKKNKDKIYKNNESKNRKKK